MKSEQLLIETLFIKTLICLKTRSSWMWVAELGFYACLLQKLVLKKLSELI